MTPSTALQLNSNKKGNGQQEGGPIFLYQFKKKGKRKKDFNILFARQSETGFPSAGATPKCPQSLGLRPEQMQDLRQPGSSIKTVRDPGA